jgi:hypothetical protein
VILLEPQEGFLNQIVSVIVALAPAVQKTSELQQQQFDVFHSRDDGTLCFARQMRLKAPLARCGSGALIRLRMFCLGFQVSRLITGALTRIRAGGCAALTAQSPSPSHRVV